MPPQLRRHHGSLLLALAVLVGSCGDRGIFGGGETGATIERHGAAISKPSPEVTVFVPQTSSGRQKQFGDQQIVAILPAMRRLAKFNALQLCGTSVTDAGIRELKTLPQLERLDVRETAVTVNGMMELQGLPKLNQIVVTRGQYSDEELAALRRSLPNTTVFEIPSDAATATRPAEYPAAGTNRAGG